MIQLKRRVWQARPTFGKACSRLVGQVFRREYMKIADGVPYEDSHVLWLQAGNWFADIRARHGGEVYSGFGGVVEWNEPVVYFRQLINISGELSETDIGTLRFRPWGCLENGQFVKEDGEVIPFEEKWITEPVDEACVWVRRDRGRFTGLEIQTDFDCIIVDEASVQAFVRDGKCWRRWLSNTSSTPIRRPMGERGMPGWALQEVIS